MTKANLQASALWVTEPGKCELRTETLPSPEPGELLVEAQCGAISRGTESLVFHGAIPDAMVESMRCPHQQGELSLPVKYGYCSVGVVTAGSDSWLGQRVFCLHPHQDRYIVSESMATLVPDEVPSARAVLAANMETAVNALWDAEPTVGSCVTVIGAGAVGLLLSRLLCPIPGVELEVVDVSSDKDEVCRQLGFRCVRPEQASGDRDLLIHATGHGAGLQTALNLAGTEASILELSWYGSRPVELQLGGPFHNRRLKIVSSQVGTVAPRMRPRWTYARRMALALNLLKDPALDALLSEPVEFVNLPETLPRILNVASATITQLIDYRSRARRQDS